MHLYTAEERHRYFARAFRHGAVWLTLGTGGLCCAAPAWAASRAEKCDDTKQSTKLWEQVYDRCIGTPHPDPGYCVLVKPSYVVVANPPQSNKPNRLVFVPTDPIPGIEAFAQRAPGLLESYLREAWNVRPQFLARSKSQQPLANVGLAINSALDRGMCHLHIHIDCVRARVRNALMGQSVGSRWVELTRLPAFVAKRFDESRFKEMSREVIQAGGPNETLASQTLVFVPAPAHGVYVLRSHHGPGGSGAGEELLEARCDASEARP